MSKALPVQVWRVSGSDCCAFMHGQTCNDIANLPIGEWQTNAYLNIKGRVVALFWIAKLSAEELLVVADAAESEAVFQRLKMFVMRSKVTIEATDFQLFARRQGGLTKQSASPTVWAAPAAEIELCFEDAADSLSADELNSTLINAGLVAPHWISGAYADAYLPQMLNLDLTGGLSFKKGCYPGQEIVARTAHRGRLKQRLTLCETKLRRDDPITDASDSKVGTVLQASMARALAVIRLEAVNADLSHCHVIPLPYALEA